MKGNGRRWARRVALASAVAMLATVGIASVAMAATPTQPSLATPFVWVSDVGVVTAQWNASTDAGGHPITYTLYRDVKPITQAAIDGGSATLQIVVDNYTGTAYTGAANASEIAQSYVWYYAVRAKADNAGTPEYSLVSKSAAPNMHGWPSDTSNSVACERCHNVHSAYGDVYYRDVALCYTCHAGATSSDPGSRSSINVKADFYEYADQTAGSRHVMSNDARRCAACHSPHRSPYYYDINGVYQPTNSFRAMLRIQTAATPAYTYTSRNDDITENTSSCLLCHGTSTTNIAYVGADAYGRTGGDHNSAGYATAAHGTAVILSNDTDTSKPQVQCLACHDNHASPIDNLLSYRKNASGLTSEATFCYKCHSAASAEARVVGSSAPFAWNSRDLQAQFAKVSHHPAYVTTGDPIAQSGTWTQTTQADFLTDTLSNTIATSGDSIELLPIYSTATALTEGFEDGTWTTDFPTRVGTWAQSTTWRATGTYSIRATGGSTANLTSRAMNLNGWSNVVVSFRWQQAGTDAGEYIRVLYSTNGSTWTEGWSDQGNSGTRNDGGTPVTFSIPSPTSTTYVRLVLESNSTTEYGYWDDILVTGDQPNGYVAAGTAVSRSIPGAAGTLASLGTLTYTKNQPAGSSLTVDVLDASDDSVLLTNVASGASLAGLGATPIKLRANLAGDAPTPLVVSDNFNDNSFDTSKWTDLFLNSTDPDSGADTPWSDTTDFELGGSWPVTWSRTSTFWRIQSGVGQTGTYCTELYTDAWNTRRTAQFSRTFDLSAYTSPSITFRYNTVGLDAGSDYFQVRYSTNGGSTWTNIYASSATNVNWTTSASVSLPQAANVLIEFDASVNATSEYVRVDEVILSGTIPGTPTDIWPLEDSGTLSIRAEGTDFWGTADEGELVYIKPTAATWVDTDDFEAVVRVPSYDNLAGNGWMKTGLMIRTGTSEANAQAANAKMAGVYVTDTNGVDFEYRTTVGGTAASGGTQAGDAPVWLKLKRIGNVITGYMSSDGSAWTEVGSQTVTMDTYVLVGVCLSSHVNGSFSESTFDDFSITQIPSTASTVTPRLDDWTVAYSYYPAATTGELTCSNCHNVHYVGKGSGAWSMARVSDPNNTKLAFSGTPTQFCLRCHDGAAPVSTMTTDTVVPYTPGFRDIESPLFVGWDKTTTGADFASGGHAATTILQLQGEFGCDTCHDPHASDNARLTALTASGGSAIGHLNSTRDNSTTWSEENLCYACHDGRHGGNCASPGCHNSTLSNLNVSTSFGLTYKHPVATSGKHADDETSAGVGSANRHSECADCHDPHATRAGLHSDTNSKAGEVLRGATGIKVDVWPANWTAVGASDWVVERMTGEATDYEAYVCFKCHSSYSGQPFSVTTASGTYTSTDIAMEFNPSNQSEHNVLGQTVAMESSFSVNGNTYNWTKPNDSAFLVSGWNSNSMMTCTACHTNSTSAAKGPHGSSAKWLIDPAYPVSWRQGETDALTPVQLNSTNMTAGVICTKCHTNLASANIAHAEHDTRGSEGGYCRFCHVGIPHGWKRPRLLGYTTDDDPYATWRNSAGQTATGNYGLVEIALKAYSPNGWDKANCYAGCSSSRHPDQSNPWP